VLPCEGHLTVSEEGTKRGNLQELMVEISRLAIRIYDTTSALNQHKAAMTGIAEKYFAPGDGKATTGHGPEYRGLRQGHTAEAFTSFRHPIRKRKCQGHDDVIESMIGNSGKKRNRPLFDTFAEISYLTTGTYLPPSNKKMSSPPLGAFRGPLQCGNDTSSTPFRLLALQVSKAFDHWSHWTWRSMVFQ